MLLAGAPVDGGAPHIVAAHARAVQRDLLRARLPRPPARLPAGRRRRPDGARRPRLPEDGLRSAAGPRASCAGSTTTTAIRSSCAPIRRWASPGWCRRGAPGNVLGRQRVRHGRARVAGAARVPAADLPAAARRDARDAGHRHLVVRRSRGARRCPPPARGRRDQAGVRRRVDGAGVPLRPRRRRPRANGPSGSAPTPDAYVVEEFLPLSHAPVWHDGRLESRALMLRVFLRRRRPRRLPRDAGRTVANRRRGSSRRLGAARRQQQGHLGAVRRAGRAAGAPSSAGHSRARSRERAIRRRAAPPSTCSGWAATRSAARTARGCFARCWPADRCRRRSPAGLHPAFLRACVASGLLAEAARPTSTASRRSSSAR